MARAQATIEVFAHFCAAAASARRRRRGRDQRDPRRATTRTEFLASAPEATGLPIRVLSREEEARYGYLAAVNSTTLADGAVLDLGGGCMQLVRVRGRHAAGARLAGRWAPCA